ncbi:neural cell adhesion molecule 1-like [Mytilus californianus]|uniref:neural cell adhesion molecule 1-like n=1 Tax=Mytilus californianus TaxID=6549 RepID=UPI0022457C2E|nr:neural cell adhesion molecule 1-like [Mytilus californianus]
MAGIDSDSVTIEVYFPPTVQIKFEENRTERQLNCVATGIPDLYIFKQWEHWSEYSDLIRYLPDSGSGNLNLQIIEGETDRYQDRGIYICKASNNVSLNGGDSFIPGEFFLNPKSTPYFVTSNNKTQYGVLGQTTNITVDFVSFPEIKNISVIFDGIIHSIENYTLEIMKVMDTVYNKTVFVNGSRLMMTVEVNTERDFKAYTFKLCNQIGSDNLTISLHSASCPETPEIIQIMPEKTQVIVQWIPKFHGGFQQSFHIQYRRRDVQYWNTKHVQDHTMNIYSIDGLTPGTEYLIRIYSSNRKGNSSFSDKKPFRTDATNEHGNLGFILLIVPFVIAVAVLYWQYKKGKFFF